MRRQRGSLHLHEESGGEFQQRADFPDQVGRHVRRHPHDHAARLFAKLRAMDASGARPHRREETVDGGDGAAGQDRQRPIQFQTTAVRAARRARRARKRWSARRRCRSTCRPDRGKARGRRIRGHRGRDARRAARSISSQDRAGPARVAFATATPWRFAARRRFSDPIGRRTIRADFPASPDAGGFRRAWTGKARPNDRYRASAVAPSSAPGGGGARPGAFPAPA